MEIALSYIDYSTNKGKRKISLPLVVLVTYLRCKDNFSTEVLTVNYPLTRCDFEKKLGVFDSGKNLTLGKVNLPAFLSLNRNFVLSLSLNCGHITPATVRKLWVHLLIEGILSSETSCLMNMLTRHR